MAKIILNGPGSGRDNVLVLTVEPSVCFEGWDWLSMGGGHAPFTSLRVKRTVLRAFAEQILAHFPEDNTNPGSWVAVEKV